MQHTCNTTCNTTTFPVNLQSKWLSGHFRRPKATSKGKGANFTPSRKNHRNLQQKCSCCTLCCTCVARWLHVLNCRVGGPYHPPLWSSPKRQKGEDGCKWSHSVYQPSQLHLHENCKKTSRTQLQVYAVCPLAPSMCMSLVFRFLGFKEVLQSLCLSTVTVAFA